jgi:N-acetylneuraminic acid mutarotase
MRLRLVALLFALPVPAVAQFWTPISKQGAPLPRAYHTAVWTGSRMIVWGGVAFTPEGSYFYSATGGAYDPATDTWTPVSTLSAPSGRTGHTAVWTGSRMIVWGGYDDDGSLASGGLYDPATDSWAPMSTTGAPSPRREHLAIWTGASMIVWGGGTVTSPFVTDGGAAYDPVSDAWTPLPPSGLSVYSATAVWTGSKLILWGGHEPSTNPATGYRVPVRAGRIYDPSTHEWTRMSEIGAPEARTGNLAVWTGSRLIVWGGHGAPPHDYDLDTGAAYDLATDTWAPLIGDFPPAGRSGASGFWTGTELIVWGAVASPGQLGGIWDAPTASWLYIAEDDFPGGGGAGGSAVWTGSRLLVWGGALVPFGAIDQGAAFDPYAGGRHSSLRFHTLSPCRFGFGGGASEVVLPGWNVLTCATCSCGVPRTAKVLALNLTVIPYGPAGNLRVFVPGGALSVSSVINFAGGSPGRTVANNLLAPIGDRLNIGLHSDQDRSSQGMVYVILDVSGYFE